MKPADQTFDLAAARLARAYRPAQPDHAWAAIAARLPEPAPTRRLAAWWWLGAALLLGGVAWWALATTSGGAAAPASAPRPGATPAVALTAEPAEHPAPRESDDVHTPRPSRARQSGGVASPESVTLTAQATEGAGPQQTNTTSTARTPATRAPGASPATSAQARAAVSPRPNVPLTPLPYPDAPRALLSDARVGPGGIPCEDFRNGGGWDLAVRLFAGAGPSGRTLDGDAGAASYLQLRDSVEEVQLSLHGGLRVEAVHSGGFTARLGVDYGMQRGRVELLGNAIRSTETVEVVNPDGEVIRVDTLSSVTQTQRVVYNRHQTVAVVGGIGFRPTFGAVSPYVLAEAGYEFTVASRGVLPEPGGEELVDLERTDDEWIAERPGLQYGGVVGVDVAIAPSLELGLSGHYTRRGGLSGRADPLDDERAALFGALNLRYSF